MRAEGRHHWRLGYPGFIFGLLAGPARPRGRRLRPFPFVFGFSFGFRFSFGLFMRTVESLVSARESLVSARESLVSARESLENARGRRRVPRGRGVLYLLVLQEAGDEVVLLAVDRIGE